MGAELVVLLAADDAFMIVEVRHGGLTAKPAEQILAAVEQYAQSVLTLARDVETCRTARGLDPVSRVVASSWLQRAAANAWLEQTRANLGIAMSGFGALQNASNVQVLSVAELAEQLHTDRATVTRTIKKAQADHPQFSTVAALGG